MSDIILPIDLQNHRYDVMIGIDILARAGEFIKPFTPRNRSFIVTDETVARLHLSTLKEALAKVDVQAEVLILPSGEATKNITQLEKILSKLIDAKIERTDAIIAFGGGVIGDITGFAAAILRRGTHFIQIPTTLLAQVDSSVGGKTAINMTQGKNLIGAFHQPALVLADITLLGTLPPRELRAGYAEILKYGLINDPGFFKWCVENGADILASDKNAQRYGVAQSVAAKAAIVAQDPTETNGTRALLNLGHTFGHALEAELGYSDRLLHGEAVSIGMMLAFDFSVQCGFCSVNDAHKLRAHLTELSMPTDFRTLTNADGATLVAHMMQDKKRQSGTLPFLLARGIGQTYLDKNVDLEKITAFLNGEHP
jgi:3-dehydroquinate synthase